MKIDFEIDSTDEAALGEMGRRVSRNPLLVADIFLASGAPGSRREVTLSHEGNERVAVFTDINASTVECRGVGEDWATAASKAYRVTTTCL